MIVLGIETSCDETAAAVVADGRTVLSSIIFSQVALHRPYGGVVPEIASRSHVENLPGIIQEAMDKAGLKWPQLDAIAVTYGPGLATSLLVGISAAKALSISLGKPLIGVNHLEGHIYSAFLTEGAPDFDASVPFLTLVVSGGHTLLVRVDGLGKYTVLGQTIDDAAGEAFDKGANLLGLGYPGGPVIDKVAKTGKINYFRFPRGKQRKVIGRLSEYDPDLCFSYSGLKTSLMYYLKSNPLMPDQLSDVAASYQEAIVDPLVDRADKALGSMKKLSAVGGVSLNSRLRARLIELGAKRGVEVLLAKPGYCMDNAAMIAAVASAGSGLKCGPDMEIDAEPNLEL